MFDAAVASLCALFAILVAVLAIRWLNDRRELALELHAPARDRVAADPYRWTH